jgi:hypothetical protein
MNFLQKWFFCISHACFRPLSWIEYWFYFPAQASLPASFNGEDELDAANININLNEIDLFPAEDFSK